MMRSAASCNPITTSNTTSQHSTPAKVPRTSIEQNNVHQQPKVSIHDIRKVVIEANQKHKKELQQQQALISGLQTRKRVLENDLVMERERMLTREKMVLDKEAKLREKESRLENWEKGMEQQKKELLDISATLTKMDAEQDAKMIKLDEREAELKRREEQINQKEVQLRSEIEKVKAKIKTWKEEKKTSAPKKTTDGFTQTKPLKPKKIPTKTVETQTKIHVKTSSTQSTSVVPKVEDPQSINYTDAHTENFKNGCSKVTDLQTSRTKQPTSLKFEKRVIKVEDPQPIIHTKANTGQFKNDFSKVADSQGSKNNQQTSLKFDKRQIKSEPVDPPETAPIETTSVKPKNVLSKVVDPKVSKRADIYLGVVISGEMASQDPVTKEIKRYQHLYGPIVGLVRCLNKPNRELLTTGKFFSLRLEKPSTSNDQNNSAEPCSSTKHSALKAAPFCKIFREVGSRKEVKSFDGDMIKWEVTFEVDQIKRSGSDSIVKHPVFKKIFMEHKLFKKLSRFWKNNKYEVHHRIKITAEIGLVDDYEQKFMENENAAMFKIVYITEIFNATLDSRISLPYLE